MADDLKNCKYCGRQVGAATNFCWYCGRELEARPERPEPTQPQSRLERWLIVGLGLAALAALAAILLSFPHP